MAHPSGPGLLGAAAAISILLVTSVPARATIMTTPVDLSAFTSGATYGPAAPAEFGADAAVTSGTGVPLFTGPSYRNVDSLLLVISGAIPAGDVLTVSFGGLAPETVQASSFSSTPAAGFPNLIGGIGNGKVNGVAFPAALHAGVALTGLPSGLSVNQLLGNFTLSQTIATDLRIDVFGSRDGRIIDNASNGNAFGLSASSADDPIDPTGTQDPPSDPPTVTAVPEPGSLAIFASALLGFGLLAWCRRKL